MDRNTIYLNKRLHSSKGKLNQLSFLCENHTISLNICSTPFNHTISLNICNTPFKETQLPSIWTGTPFIWRKGFTHHKENCIFPKASHLKGKLHIPKEYLRMFSIQYFFDYGLWRMHLIDTWCLRGQMNQIWPGLIWLNPSDQILEQHKKKKFWVTYFGTGGGEKALQCIVFVFFCVFFVLVLVFFADSRWLTLQWNSQWNRKKVGPGGRDEHIIIIIWISQYLLRTIVIIHHVYVFSCMYPNLFCHVPPLANRLRSPLEARDALRNFRRFGGPAWVRRVTSGNGVLMARKGMCYIYIYIHVFIYIYMCVCDLSILYYKLWSLYYVFD